MSWGSRPLGWPRPEFGKTQVCALLFGGLLFVTPASAQIVTGRVVDAADNEPVAGATVTLLDQLAAPQRAVVSNSAGNFIMSITSAGTYRLWAGRIGYATIESPAIEIGDGEVVEVEVRLAVEAVAMEPLTVVVRRPETQRERDLRGFYERTERYGESDIGPRQIYTRDKLAGWYAFSVEEVFRFYIRWTPYGSGCNPKVYLDGRQYGHLGDLGSMPGSILEGKGSTRAVAGSSSSGRGRYPRAEAA